jgi:hypothetical protein
LEHHAGLLATEPLFVGGQIAEGDSLGEIATDPLNYLGASFLILILDKLAKHRIKSSNMQKQ